MKDFDYEDFIDRCEFGYELQTSGKYIPIVKLEVVKASFFGKLTVLKWYSHRMFEMHIYNELGIDTSMVYIQHNLDFSSVVNDCSKFIVITIYPENYCMYPHRDNFVLHVLGESQKIDYEYMSVEQYKDLVKSDIRSSIESEKRRESERLKQKQKEKEALDEFNKHPFHFIRCGK